MTEKREVVKARERACWELRLQGLTQERIAGRLGICQSAVCKILGRVERRLAVEFRKRVEETKARQTAQLELIAEEAFRQWHRSCEDGESLTVKEGRVKATESGSVISLPDEVTRTRTTQSGNPALLEKAMRALADIRAIWGLESARRTEVAGFGDELVKVYLFPREEV